MKITTKEINKKEKSINLLIEGELVLSNCEKAKKIFLEILPNNKIFKVQLENVESIDLAFSQLLISFFDTIKNEKKQITLEKEISEDIQKILDTTGINKYIEKYIES